MPFSFTNPTPSGLGNIFGNAGGGLYQDANGVWRNADGSIYWGVAPASSGNSGGSTRSPQVTANAGGITVNSTPLDKILEGVLSGLAIIKGANAIPTKTSGDNYGGSYGGQYSPAELALLQSQGAYSRSDGTTLGKVETYVKNNTGVVAIGVLVVAALFLDPFAKGKKR
jgi:hypothetical protein